MPMKPQAMASFHPSTSPQPLEWSTQTNLHSQPFHYKGDPKEVVHHNHEETIWRCNSVDNDEQSRVALELLNTCLQSQHIQQLILPPILSKYSLNITISFPISPIHGDFNNKALIEGSDNKLVLSPCLANSSHVQTGQTWNWSASFNVAS